MEKMCLLLQGWGSGQEGGSIPTAQEQNGMTDLLVD
jgi:hypothetical protein